MNLGDENNDDCNELHHLFSENIMAQRSPESSKGSDESMKTVILSEGNDPQSRKTNVPEFSDNSEDADTEDADTEDADTEGADTEGAAMEETDTEDTDTEETDNVDCSTGKSITSYYISEEGDNLSFIVSSILSEILKNISDDDEYECTENDLSDDDSEDGISTDEGIVATDSDEEDWMKMTDKKCEAIYVFKSNDMKVNCD